MEEIHNVNVTNKRTKLDRLKCKFSGFDIVHTDYHDENGVLNKEKVLNDLEKIFG